MNAFFSVSVCGINRKKFSSVPVNNLHFHEQLLMSQDKSIYNLRVEGKWTRNEILYCFPFNLNISNVKKQNQKKHKKIIWNGRNETIH